MPARILGVLVAALVLIMPACASADYAHVVASGETLTSIAALDGLSVDALAAANGLSTQSELISGSILEIPPQSAYTEAGSPAVIETPAPAAPTSATPVANSSDGAGYVVQAGDTLTAIAARDGTTVAELAALNGLDPDGILDAGAVLQLPGSGSADVTSDSESGSGSGSGGPYPTDQTVDGPQIADIADADGVPASLAQAIGWQESGWNNDEVSDEGAVGVMQITPSTWSWIADSLTDGAPLSPDSANDNVRGGVLFLRSLLNSTGGSESLAAAGYYQGLTSVQEHGLYPDTQQYVNDVAALQAQFGGG